MNRDIKSSNTESLYNKLYNTTNWRNYENSFNSFYIMAQNSAKMENIAKNYKKLYNLAISELQNLKS
jgi:hypothetical protein